LLNLILFKLKLLSFLECKVWRNPLGLFRGAEYSRYLNCTKREPLTFYDMNLSAQDHQAFFICDADSGKPDYESKKKYIPLNYCCVN
jgi:hypothetical protein